MHLRRNLPDTTPCWPKEKKLLLFHYSQQTQQNVPKGPRGMRTQAFVYIHCICDPFRELMPFALLFFFFWSWNQHTCTKLILMFHCMHTRKYWVMGEITGVVLLGFVAIHLADILTVVSVASPTWLVGNTTESNSSKPSYTKGLWRECDNGDCFYFNLTTQPGTCILWARIVEHL